MKHLSFIILFLLSQPLHSQPLQKKVEEWAASYTRTDCNIKPSKVKSCTINPDDETITIVMEGGFPEQHFNPTIVENIYSDLKSLLPKAQRGYDITVLTDSRRIEDLVPIALRKGKKDATRILQHRYKGNPWVKNVSRPYTATEGLEGNHIALWQSHGRYVKPNDNDWWWQRPRLFGTCEDLLSQTFVIPYIIPMLQNAGATVFTPRERDWQSHEVIVDNDQPNKNGIYIESMKKKNGKLRWKTCPRNGFAQYKELYQAIDSPFCDGSARYVPTVSSAKEEAVAHWVPRIPEDGRYAVYVAYQSYDNSADDAIYTVHHKGGMTEFQVNQKMGGGTWVYLGTFEFEEGVHDYGQVTLSNRCNSDRSIVTADAVRFGGGMGNVVPASYGDTIAVSGMPRWAEAAKYSTVWYGFPYKIHTQTFGRNDYNNDIRCRSLAVNYLSGKSIYNPNAEEGLGVPLDATIAFHTDAGFSATDEYVGSLSIYKTDYNEGKTGAGVDRYVSRDLSSMLLANLSSDLKKYNWQVRQLWNRDYGEARDPMSPACILEMLSHQNFADMRLAYDPKFKFDFCRSVYKTIVKFVASQYGRDYTIQPLPVQNFAITLNEKKSTATLHWEPTADLTEATAKPSAYIVYTRRGYQGFDNGTLVKGNEWTVKLLPNEVYSFKVAAVNQGGESFPSEVLSAGIASKNQGTVLIVNGFTRLEGPAVVNTSSEAGFDIDKDPGVPYGAFAGYCGNQRAFSRSRAGSEASDGLGASGREYEGKVMMGNTFDYTAIHAHGIMLTGKHSFTSTSEQALLEGNMKMSDYPITDLIYGTQKVFNSRLNTMVETYYKNGGKLIISAANSGGVNVGGTTIGTLTDKECSTVSGCGLTFDIYRKMNPISYSVPAPSVLSASQPAFAILTYGDGSVAGIAQKGKLVRLGFPLESITDERKTNLLMKAFIDFVQ